VRVRLWIVWYMDVKTAARSIGGRDSGQEVALYAEGTDRAALYPPVVYNNDNVINH